jgi:hypothetical protein
MKSLKKILFFMIIGVTLCVFPVSSGVKAMSYNYDYWKNIIPSAEGIAYGDTYYGTDIFDAETYTKNVSFDDLEDLTVYDGKIYILDGRSKSDTQVLLADGTYVGYTGSSKIVVLNQDYQYETIKDEFLITDEVKQKLSDYYSFNIDLDKINGSFVNGSEYISFYKDTIVQYSEKDFSKNGVILSQTISNHTEFGEKVTVTLNGHEVKFTFGEVEKVTTDTKGSTVVTKVDGVIIDEADVTEYSNSHSAVLDATDEVSIDDYAITTYGRAPYLAYSEDPTKACVRLKQAQGIMVNDQGIFIADTNNMRILKLNFDWVVTDVYFTPEDTTFYQVSSGKTISEMKDTATLFRPQKIAINTPGHLYAIAQDVYAGIIEYGTDCTFNRFLGKNTVVANPLKKFWAKIFTSAQLSSMALDLPPMFTNITIYNDFIYATSYADENDPTAANMVKAINTTGTDIMTKNGYVKPDGDVVFITTTTEEGVVTGPSNLMGITVSSKTQNFATVDSTRGRIFVYDNEGNLLYVAGEQPGGISSAGNSGLSNSIINPVAISYFYRTLEDGTEEEDLLILDQSSKSLMIYNTTEFGKLVNEATYLYQIGDTINAEVYWREVIKRNTNYELAYLGIGKSLQLQGKYQEAMKYFKLAHSGTYYSKAFEKYRDQVLKDSFGLVMTLVLVCVVGGVAVGVTRKIVKKRKNKIVGQEEDNE